MTRRHVLPLVAACFLAACQATPAVVAPVTTAQVMAGRGNLVIAPTVAGGATRKLMAAITPYDDAAIDHMVVKLLTVDGQGAETDTLQAVDVPNADLYNAISFTNLNFDTKYRVRAYAYKAAGDDADDLISLSSYVDLEVETDDRPVLGNLVVNLKDRTFSGEATSSGLTVDAGEITHTGTEGALLHSSLVLNAVGTRLNMNPIRVSALAVDADGVVFFAASNDSAIYRVPVGSSTATVDNGTLNSPDGLSIGADGRMLVVDGPAVFLAKPDGSTEPLAGDIGSTGDNPPDSPGATADAADARFGTIQGLSADPDGGAAFLDTDADRIRRVSKTGVVSNLTADGDLGDDPRGLVRGRDGAYYVADTDNSRILRVTTQGAVSVYAGAAGAGFDDGPVATAGFFNLSGALAFDRTGALYVADGARVRRIDAGGKNVTTVAGDPFDSAQTDGTGFQGGSDYGTARFQAIETLAVSPDGEVLVGTNGRLRRIYNGN